MYILSRSDRFMVSRNGNSGDETLFILKKDFCYRKGLFLCLMNNLLIMY